MAGPTEIELKLDVAATAIGGIAGAAAFVGAAFVDREQVSTYFDTPARELRAAGLSLRVRRIGERRVQTIKAEARAAAGLFARPEWERDVPGDAPVIDGTTPLAGLIDDGVAARLAPVFEIVVTRSTALVARGDDAIEVAIDQGAIAADGRRAGIAEVELELKRGAPAALFALARALDAETPVRLGVRTKSERGYGLLAAKAEKAVRAEARPLAGEMSAGEAFAAVAASCLRQFRLNEDLLRAGGSAAALHQARVALRRLRSAFSIFARVVADARADPLRAELRWLAGVLGEARDLDVLIAAHPGLEAPRAEREAAYARVGETLDSARARALMLDLAEWIAIGAWRSDPALGRRRDRAAADYAGDQLDRLRKRLKRRGAKLATMGDEDRHRVRILAKKLRYAAEFFEGLFAGKKPRRRAERFLKHLEALQSALGELNDAATAPTVLARLGLPPQPVDPAREAGLIDEAVAAYDELIEVKRFW